jgi:PAS domain S-box-containing protein/putative nucleotidyltransferase with HDIG domain
LHGLIYSIFMSDIDSSQETTLEDKDKSELVEEIKELRSRIAELEESEKESEQVEEELLHSKEKYHTLFNKIADPIFIFDKKSQLFIDCNEAVQRIYGYSIDELKSMTIFDLHAPEDLKKIENKSDASEIDPLFSYTHITKYGQKIDVEIATDEIFYDGRNAGLSIVRDITERRKAEENLRKARDELEERVKKRTVELEEINKQMRREIADREKAERELKVSFKKLRKTLDGIVHAMAIVGEARDPYTAGHQRRVAELAAAIADEMGLEFDKIEGIRIAGLLHDIGKISVPSEILSRPGRLTAIEFSFIKSHPQVGYDVLKGIEFPWPIADIVLQHHERIDGSGYPKGLKGKEILIEAKILGVADVVEAMSSHRPYRPALGIDKALAEVLKNRGVLYDSEVVNACVKVFAEKGFEFT